MSQTHLPQRQIPRFEDAWLIPAVRPTGKAIVFVHGYGGNAIETWSEFPQLLQSRSGETGHDLIFYGYDGLRAELVASAGIFGDFLGRLFTESAPLLNQCLPQSAARAPDFAFEKVVVVAHSLGAVIARWALLDATRAGDTWASTTQLVLFAPAHTGAKITQLAGEVLGTLPILKWFSAGARFQSPLIGQLAEGSAELRMLKDQTERAIAEGKNAHLIATKVFIAQYEKIVSNIPLLPAERATTIPKANHTSICKPRADFLEPLDGLLQCL